MESRLHTCHLQGHIMLNHNDDMQIGRTRPQPDALALEYKRDYGTARRNLDITNIVNNPAANGLCRVLS